MQQCSCRAFESFGDYCTVFSFILQILRSAPKSDATIVFPSGIFHKRKYSRSYVCIHGKSRTKGKLGITPRVGLSGTGNGVKLL